MDAISQKSRAIALQKWLIRARFGSKSTVRTSILSGLVRVDGVVVTRFAHPVFADSVVTVDGQCIPAPDCARHVWLMNKPKKHLTQIENTQQRAGLGQYLPTDLPRLFPVGRLDYNSEGALLWTDDGPLARRILHPDTHLPKTYHVKIRGHIAPDDPRLDRMRAGMAIEEGYITRPITVRLGERRTRATWVEMVLTEGKNRQIRRMCAKLNYQIVKLRRVSIGPIQLGELNPRCCRALESAEMAALYAAVGLVFENADPTA